METIIVGAVVVLIAGAIVFNMVKKKRGGKPSCGCGCSGCGLAGICHTEDK